MSAEADFGLVGLAVMGQNLVLNIADHGHTVAVYNRTTEKMTAFIEGDIGDAKLVGCETLPDFVDALSTPRKIMLLVRAGPAVDAIIDQLTPLLDPGDIIIDGGNALYTDTVRRFEALEEQGLRFIGAGVSGGEEGARHGPSIMPGGSPEAWPEVAEILQGIAAKAPDGTPCCDWIGPGGAGHFVKMVHNGIEYGDMQVIAEAYDLLSAMGLSNGEMSEAFRHWGDGLLDSFLVDITAEILAFADSEDRATIDDILDVAGQKGTGTWTAVGALEAGQPLTLVAEAVFARVLSSFKEQRLRASETLAGPDRRLEPGAIELDDLRDALYASKIVSYAQGFMLLRAASIENDWDLDLGRIASLWRAGCIIRAAFLDDITGAFADHSDLDNLVLADRFQVALANADAGWRRVVAAGVAAGVPMPAYTSALSFLDGYRSGRLPANLIQAQRDYFGAHTYARVDGDPDAFFHTDWTGHGGAITAGSYNA